MNRVAEKASVALLDLTPQDAAVQQSVEAALLRVSRSGRYILGREVDAFEAEWASYCGAAHCVGTGNCLDSMRLIMMAYGIGPGDEVIVPSNTYIATWLAVSLVGATPVPAEPDPKTFNLDPRAAEAAITPRTKAILGVHLYGMPFDGQALMKVATKHGLLLLEDAAQGHGASAWWRAAAARRRVGSFGHAAAFSFYPSKNLGALGDAGAITTNDGIVAARVRRLRNYGGVGRLDHTVRGINSRLDEMQAAVLRAKLPHLDRLNAARAARAGRYIMALRGVGLVLPMADDGHVWHQFVVRAKHRNTLMVRLQQLGVDCHVHYPVPPHLEGAYADMGLQQGDFPVAEELALQVFSLPIGYDFDQDRVVSAIWEASAGLTV